MLAGWLVAVGAGVLVNTGVGAAMVGWLTAVAVGAGALVGVAVGAALQALSSRIQNRR
jgi:hypothetical protein